jgi:hypothetical protein
MHLQISSIPISIWDLHEIEKVKIGFGTCRDRSLIPIYVALGEEACIVVLIEGVFDAFEECKIFIQSQLLGI